MYKTNKTNTTNMQSSFESRLNELYEQMNNSSTQQLLLPNFEIENTTTNTYWHNVKKFLRTVNRPSEHFIDFLSNELNEEINQKTDSLSDGYVFIGRVKKNNITNAAKKYVTEYCKCKTCGSFDTDFTKNNKLRMHTIICKDCSAELNI